MASTSNAAAVTIIGSNLVHDPSDAGCVLAAPVTNFTCTFAQRSAPGDSLAAGGLTSAVDGRVVRWRVKMGVPKPDTVKIEGTLVIMRGNAAAGAGPSEVIALAAGTYTFSVDLPIKAGTASPSP